MSWKRITHDPRHDGFTYHCANGHSWFVSFDRLASASYDSTTNICRECADHDTAGEAPTNADKVEGADQVSTAF